MEVMSVIVVVGILSAIAVPRFLAAHGAYQLDGELQTLYQDMEWARLQTVTTQQRQYVVFDSAGRQWRIYRESGANQVCNPGVDMLVLTHRLDASVNFGFGSNFTSLPASLPATTGFASTAVVRSGLGAGTASIDDCLEGAVLGSGSWNNTATACVSRGVPDFETGIVYLSSTRTKARAVAVVYNPTGTYASLQLQRWAWSSGTWSKS